MNSFVMYWKVLQIKKNPLNWKGKSCLCNEKNDTYTFVNLQAMGKEYFRFYFI